jgi:nucleotide-binding universal stress UspA family protein
MVDDYKNILVAVDGSEQSKKAFDEAINIAKRNKGKLTLATVIDTASFSGTTGGNSIPLMQEVHEKAQKIITDGASSRGGGARGSFDFANHCWQPETGNRGAG